ncbi:hypothetical protein MRB53_040517 [Persea americana]|nr:hypothetical protein MRB53_040517 [Persea americana]
MQPDRSLYLDRTEWQEHCVQARGDRDCASLCPALLLSLTASVHGPGMKNAWCRKLEAQARFTPELSCYYLASLDRQTVAVHGSGRQASPQLLLTPTIRTSFTHSTQREMAPPDMNTIPFEGTEVKPGVHGLEKSKSLGSLTTLSLCHSHDIIHEFDQITIPITLVCAGNRRKEQNQVRKGSGFNWGSAGVSTSLWTGPLLRDIIARAKPQKSGKFVCFAGDDELPNGYYETCVRMSWAKSFERAIVLAHKQNGQALAPDHGRPLRIIVPGAIGGRSVKWLTKIVVTAEPSRNWYHIYDNRVLPTQVDPNMAKEDKAWWSDERTWRIALIDYPEDAYRSYEGDLYGGKIDMSEREACWCWCFWKLTVPTTELSQCTGLVVRAMDENMNLQPRDMYWNIMSMLNNCWFRVAVHKVEPDARDGKQSNSEHTSLRFEHPTQAALIPGGWMERVKKAGGDLQAHGWVNLLISLHQIRKRPKRDWHQDDSGWY